MRRFAYSCFYDETKNYPQEYIEPMPAEWLAAWDSKGINLRNLNDPEISWHDYSVLNSFKECGAKKFYNDDIWKYDWEKCRLSALKLNKAAPDKKIIGPGTLYKTSLKLTDKLYSVYRKLAKS